MKIISNAKIGLIALNKLNSGEVFSYENEQYVRGGDMRNGYAEVTNTKTGQSSWMKHAFRVLWHPNAVLYLEAPDESISD